MPNKTVNTDKTVTPHTILQGADGSTLAAVGGGLPVTQDGVADAVVVSGTVNALGVLFTVDMTGYAAIAIHYPAPGASSTLSFEGSNDSTTWVPLLGERLDSSTTSVANTASGTGLGATTGHIIRVPTKTFRLRCSTFGTGPITAYGCLRKQAPGDPLIMLRNGAQNIGSIDVEGFAAHDAVISGFPVRIGMRAVTASPTAVASGDVVDAVGTPQGKAVILADAIPEETWSYAAAASGIVATTTAVTIKAAGAANIRNYVKSLEIAHDLLGNVTELAIRDGAAGTVLWRTKLQTPATETQSIKFEPPLRGSVATLLEVVTLSSATGGVFVNAQGYAAS